MSEAKGLQPGTLPIRHMVQLAHDLLPFDSADCNDKIILDVGCGPGQVTEHLLEEYRSSLFPVSGDHHNNHNHKAHILASDFSAPMIAQLTSRKEKEIAKGNGIWECVDAKVCDAQDLGMMVRDRVASHVFASLVLFMLPEPRQGLSEMKRVLGRGGVAACTSWRGSEWIDLMRVGAASASASAEGKQEEEEEIGAGDEEKVKGKGKGKMEIPKEWSSAEGVRREMEDVGFVDVQVVESEARWDFESHEGIVDLILGFPGMEIMVGESWGEGGREKAREGMLGWMRERFSRGEGALTGVAIVGVGRREL
ncbi:hypothetical protein ACHAO1_007900 [Botrytis cinerea]